MTYLDTLFSLKDKVAIVTGAARGNGKAIALGLKNAGADVVAVDIAENDIGCDMYYCDIATKSNLSALVEYVIDKYGKINILVNNAGVSFGSDFTDYPEELWAKTYEVNLKAPFELTKLVAEHMKTSKTGSIINITSLNAELAFPNNPAYMAFKGALKQLTKSTAYDLGSYGVRANNLGPGYIKTSMTEESWYNPKLHNIRKNRTLLGRWGNPEDLIGAAIFLASDASSYITGQDIYVDGGWLTKGL